VIKLLTGAKPVAVLCLVLVALVAAPAGTAGAVPWTGRYSIWRSGAFATQYLDASCVGASVQIMLNLIDGGRDHGKSQQLNYLAYAAAHSKYPVEDGGADPQGWAEALVHYGAGADYGWTNDSTSANALHDAAAQMRETDKPVGLLVHFGRHAWIMTGFAATADPATTSDFTVTEVEVVGPLWPSGTLNGVHFDPGPGTWFSTQDLARKFDAYVEPGQPLWDGKYVTIVPKASSSNPGGPTDDPPDIQSALGWIWIFQELARVLPVRDFLWLPPLLR
jgi:hypothetical protein